MNKKEDYRGSHMMKEQASHYDAEFQNDNSPSGILWYLEQQILERLLSGLTPSRALDFACGTGRILSFLETRVPETMGIDISEEMLNIARTRCLRSELICRDITRDPQSFGDHFDLITAFRFFLESQDELRNQVLDILREIIAPNGYLIVNFHRNPYSMRGAYLAVKARLTKRDFTMVSVSQAKKLLTDHRFSVEKIIGYSHQFYRSNTNRIPFFRRSLDSILWRIPFLRSFGLSFIIIARPC